MSELLHVLAESAQLDDATVPNRDAEKASEKHRNERMDVIEGVVESPAPETAKKAITCQPEVNTIYS